MKKERNEGWSIEDMGVHIKAQNPNYGSAVVIAALFKELYGEFPNIGLSGFQADCADIVIKKIHGLKKEKI